jgi:hypothetical protein
MHRSLPMDLAGHLSGTPYRTMQQSLSVFLSFLLLLNAYTYIEVYVCPLTRLAMCLLCACACGWTTTHRLRTCAEYAA